MAADHTKERERLRAIFNELKEQGKVRYNRDFLGFTKMSEGDISTILNPESERELKLPERHKKFLFKMWDISPLYYEKGIGPMFKQDETVGLLKDILAELKEIKNLLKP